MIKHFFICIIGFVFIACSSKKPEIAKNNAPQPVLVDVIVAGTKQLSNLIETNGTVIANESVEIKPEVSGRLIYLNVPDGGNVSTGSILAKINDAELQAQLIKSKTQLVLAEKTEDRLKKLLAINGINQADYDAALNNVNNIKADIQFIKAQIDKTVIKAPFSGVLGLRQVSPGAYITPQNVLATLQQVNKVKIDFNIPELYIGLIQKGSTVKVVTTNSTNSKTATVIATQADINANTRNLKARAVLNGSPISPGSFVKVLINASNKANNIVVPTSAIIPDAVSKKLIVVKNGKGNYVNIETGLRTAGGVEILNGVKPGDSIVVTGILFVRPNAPVKIKTVKKLEDWVKE